MKSLHSDGGDRHVDDNITQVSVLPKWGYHRVCCICKTFWTNYWKGLYKNLEKSKIEIQCGVKTLAKDPDSGVGERSSWVVSELGL